MTHLKGNALVVYDSPAGNSAFDQIQKASGNAYTAVKVPDMINANVLSFPKDKLLLLQNKCQKSIDIVKKYLKSIGEPDWTVVTLDMSETIKGDWALTCQSVILNSFFN